LGGERLKIPVLALLCAAGFLVIIPQISAQQAPQQDATEAPLQTDAPFRAAEQEFSLDEEGGASNIQGPSIWSVIQMLLTLALVAAAIYGIVFLIRKSSKQTVNKDPFLKLLASAHLGSNRYAHIVSVGSRAWILGSSDGGVNLIGEIDDKDVINAMLLEDSRKSAQAPGKIIDFMSMLRRLGLPSEKSIPGAEEIRKRSERLKGM
jgi:flagellar protein FliO/FliZ